MGIFNGNVCRCLVSVLLGTVVVKAAGHHLISSTPMRDKADKGIPASTKSSLWAPFTGVAQMSVV